MPDNPTTPPPNATGPLPPGARPLDRAASAIPGRTLTTVLGLVVPLVMTAAAALVALSWRDELPDPVATHWGGDEGVDGSGSLTGLVVAVALGAVVCAFLGWALAYFAGRQAMVRRSGVGLAVGVTAFLDALLLGALWIQRGLDDWTQAPDADGAIGVAIAAGVVLGVGVALVVRPDTARPAGPDDPVPAAALDLPAGARAAWVRHQSSRALVWIGAGVAVALVVTGVLTGTALGLIPLGVLVGGLVVAMSSFTVTVDSRGLAARGALGWPRLTVPADEIVGVEVIDVDPITQYGGWGYRVGRQGQVAIVSRRGEAIQMTRTGGRVSVVTVDDAATGAALLSTIASRAR